jgi:hypothetical protein
MAQEAVHVVANERTLQSLIGPLGRSYLHKRLPPRWLLLGGACVGLGWAALDATPLPRVAAVTALVGALLAGWPRKGQRRLPLWQGLGAAAALTIEAGFAFGADAGVVDGFLVALCVASLLQVGWHLARALLAARRVQDYGRTLDERQLLSLLPPDARDDLQQWQRGDDAKAAELRLVVHLAALWLAISALDGGGARKTVLEL